jgi:hypothetical protein
LGELDEIRLVILSVLFLLLGGQTVLAGIFFGLLNLLAVRRKQNRTSTPRETATSSLP